MRRDRVRVVEHRPFVGSFHARDGAFEEIWRKTLLEETHDVLVFHGLEEPLDHQHLLLTFLDAIGCILGHVGMILHGLV